MSKSSKFFNFLRFCHFRNISTALTEQKFVRALVPCRYSFSVTLQAACYSRTEQKTVCLQLTASGRTKLIYDSFEDHTSFQNLCMLDTVEKIFEQAIKEWLRKHLQGKRILSVNQNGYSAGHSTINETWKLKKLAASAIKKHYFGTAASFDIQNAFNPMTRMHIMDVLKNAKVLVKLCNIIQDYFRNQLLLAQTASCMTIRHSMWCSARVSPWTPALEYRH